MNSIGLRILVLVLVGMTVLCGWGNVAAQSSEAKQLMLNVEKLSQLKNILSDMKKGYTIVSQGYGRVKDIAAGNFSLHEVFLDGLLVVSPKVRKYHRVADIISAQQAIVSEYRAASKAFGSVEVFNAAELAYMGRVYAGLLEASLQHLEDLALVVTSSKLRMDDGERLRAIDRIFLEVSDRLEFLRGFNRDAVLLFRLKQSEQREIAQLRKYYDY